MVTRAGLPLAMFLPSLVLVAVVTWLAIVTVVLAACQAGGRADVLMRVGEPRRRRCRPDGSAAAQTHEGAPSGTGRGQATGRPGRQRRWA